MTQSFCFKVCTGTTGTTGTTKTQATEKKSFVPPLHVLDLKNIFFFPALAAVPKPEATAQTVETARLSARGLRSTATIEGGSKSSYMCCDCETLVFSKVAQRVGKHQAVACS